MEQKSLVQSCIESLNKHDAIRNRFKNAAEPEQRLILTAWYAGVLASTPPTEVDRIPLLSTFLDAATNAVHKAVAA